MWVTIGVWAALVLSGYLNVRERMDARARRKRCGL